MSNVTIGNAAFEVDFFSLDIMDAFDEAEQAVGQAIKRLDGERSGAYMRRCCQAMMDAIDHVVGEGACEQAFGSCVHWNEVLNSWQNLKGCYYETVASCAVTINDQNRQLTDHLQHLANAPIRAVEPSEEDQNPFVFKRKAVKLS